MIVYKVTNLENGKIYIGQSVNTLKYRQDQHYRETYNPKKKNSYFHNALEKHKPSVFKWEVIRECKCRTALDYWETYYIKHFNTMDRETGYNLKTGGNTGSVYHEDVKCKIGASTKQRWENLEISSRMLNGLRKGTQTVKDKAASNFIDFTCPTCGKVLKLKPWQAKNRKFCSNSCNLSYENGLNSANVANTVKYENTKQTRLKLLKEWCLNNEDLILNCKLNKLSFLQDLCDYIGVKDQRSLAKVLNLKGRKETIIYLRNIINENVRRTYEKS
jgi:group I intron endonuclease